MSIRLPLFLRAAPAPRAGQRRCGLFASLLASLALFSGCAQLPPGQGSNAALSGKRLRVTIQFNASVNPNFHYFFLINYDQSQGQGGNQNATGPVAVLRPVNANQGYGNGFAAGSGGSAFGFTDFVRFEGNAYRLFHVVGDPTRSRFVDEGQPVSFTLPNGGNPAVLQFDIDLSQIVVASSGAALDPTTAVNQALNIRWLQMNIVATDVIPVNQTTLVNKQVDSLGNTQTPTGAASFLSLDVSQIRSYMNQDFVGQAVFEPTGDVYGSVNPDPALDIINYTIAVVKQ